jgi:isoamylase
MTDGLPDAPRLGAVFSADGTLVTFRVHAPDATRVELWVYDSPVDTVPLLSAPMVASAGSPYTLRVPISELQPDRSQPIFYGYRAWGPNWPYDPAWQPGSAAGFLTDVDADAHRFNPNKLLLDPYAREISHCVQTPEHPDRAGYLSGPLNRATDSGPFAPKGIVLPAVGISVGRRPTRHLKDDIVYEVHVRGFTKTDPSIPAALRGTYAGAAMKAGYLRDLGITAVEFQPVCQSQNALNDLVDHHPDHNYWGYQTMGFFAPDRRLAADQSAGGPTREWMAMVEAFHDAGLKVFIDVVYNHHEEGDVDASGQIGTIYSLRGLDNPGYYETLRSTGQPQQYWNSNGVGPNLNAASDIGRDLVIDSLCYWSDERGVDGFRFDLGAVLGNRNSDGGFTFDTSDPNNILNRALTILPERPIDGGPGIDLIAEPYIGKGDNGWELGRFPRGWAEWNTYFRDTIRKSQNKLGQSDLTPGDFVRRIAGSDDLFGGNGRKPSASINFVTCHDGFCLRDLHSYAARQNDQPWPYGPSDGGNDSGSEMCWDHGGDLRQQLQATRTSLALTMLATGVPMISGGSEIHRTQHGNDNAYNIDTFANWFDWSLLQDNAALFAFTSKLMGFRNAHPALRRAEFFSGQAQNGSTIKDVTWLRPDGIEMDGAYFADPGNHFIAWQIDGAPAADPASRIYIAYNGWVDPIDAILPSLPAGQGWFLALDTSAAAIGWDNARSAGAETAILQPFVTVDGRSCLVAIAHASP